MVNVTFQPLYPWISDLVSILVETDCTPGLVWMGVENPVPTEIPFLDRQVTYQLHYPSPCLVMYNEKMLHISHLYWVLN